MEFHCGIDADREGMRSMTAVEKLSDFQEPKTGLTRKIAAFAVETRFEDIPDAVIDGAKRSQLDTLGVALGGVADDEAAKILGRFARDLGGPGEATVVGQGFKASLPYAALANGTAADVIGFSDVAMETMNHPSPSVCAALWALAEKIGASGRDILAAHAIGLEIAEKTGHGIRPQFHQRGWEPRGVLNTFGAAAACARLLGLDAGAAANALGICGAEASGMRAVKGTMSKAYITGMAARNGLEAALLAARGFTGPANVFEARDGVLQTFGEGADGEIIRQNLGNPWEYIAPGITYKAHPVCTCSHPAIEAALKLRAEHGVKADDVESIVCATTPGAADWLPFSEPTGKFQGKYSMPFIVALALVEGRVVLGDVTDGKLQDPGIRALMEKISMTVLEEYRIAGYTPSHAPYGCQVTMTLKDGREVVHKQDNPAWGPATPPAWDALAGKYRSCAELVLDADATRRSIALIGDFENLETITELMDTVRG